MSAVPPARRNVDGGDGRRVAGRHSFFFQSRCRALGVTKLALDQFLLDDEIEELIKTHVDNDDINTSFVSNFEDCAKSIYRGSHPSLYAQMKLGF